MVFLIIVAVIMLAEDHPDFMRVLLLLWLWVMLMLLAAACGVGL